MNKPFNNLCYIPDPVGSIIHIGAGLCSELKDYLALAPQKVILLEPEKSQYESLSKKVHGLNQVDVFPYAISDKSNEGAMCVLSNKKDCSLLEPGELKKYYPGLTVIGNQDVDIKSLDNFLGTQTLAEELNHLLVLEVQGMEGKILTSTHKGLLQKFHTIIVRHSETTLYHEEYRVVLNDFFQGLGFELEQKASEPYGTLFQRLIYLRNQEKIDLCMVIEEKEGLTNIINKQANQLQRLHAESDLSNATLKIKDKEIARLEKLLIETRNKLTEQKHMMLNVQAELEKFQQICHDNKLVQGEMEKKLQEKNVQAENADENITRLIKELQEAKQTASLSVKLQTLKEAELADLKKRYSDALLIQENQHELLNKLSERLRLASGYFHQISQERLLEKESLKEENVLPGKRKLKLFSLKTWRKS